MIRIGQTIIRAVDTSARSDPPSDIAGASAGSHLGGHGVGAPCSVCDLSSTTDQLEIEIDFAYEGSAAGVEMHHFHPRCFAAWEFERTRRPGL